MTFAGGARIFGGMPPEFDTDTDDASAFADQEAAECRDSRDRIELVAKMLARLGSTSMEDAVADVRRKLERWVKAAERLVRIANVRGGFDVHEKRETAEELEAITRELRYLVAP